MSKIKVLIADDHAVVRMGLTALLQAADDFSVVGEADDGLSAIRKTFRLKPDIVIMDLMMPGTDGIAATREIHRECPNVKILVLTTSTISDDLSHAIEAGAAGVITKSSVKSRLLSSIRAIAAGQTVVSPEIRQLISEDPPVQELTARQTEILASVTRGLTNADIATQFAISPESVKDHINAIFAKLGAANRTEAVTIALRKHLLKI